MNEIVLKTDHIVKTYKGNLALNQVSVTIERGDIYGLVGNNGAGKTTFMRIIAGQTNQDEGNVTLFSKQGAKDIEKQRNRVGTLIEDPGFFANMSAKDNLEYFRLQFGIPGKEVVDKILKDVHLEYTKNKKYKDFSLGMKQRLGIALALLQTPEFLILDEPINGLDPAGIIEVRQILIEMNQKRNTTILISSHILAEMANIATKYGFLSHGKLLEEISADDLLQKCNTYMDITVKDVKKMCVLLEKELSFTNFKVYPDNHIHLFEGLERGEELCELAVVNHLGLSSIEKKVLNLENYYMNMVEVG